jgi:hypothetical protein
MSHFKGAAFRKEPKKFNRHFRKRRSGQFLEEIPEGLRKVPLFV